MVLQSIALVNLYWAMERTVNSAGRYIYDAYLKNHVRYNEWHNLHKIQHTVSECRIPPSVYPSFFNIASWPYFRRLYQYKCCGWINPSDWFNLVHFVPGTCCNQSLLDECAETSGYENRPPCVLSVKHLLNNSKIEMFALLAVLFVTQVSARLWLYLVTIYTRRIYSRWHDYELLDKVELFVTSSQYCCQWPILIGHVYWNT